MRSTVGGPCSKTVDKDNRRSVGVLNTPSRGPEYRGRTSSLETAIPIHGLRVVRSLSGIDIVGPCIASRRCEPLLGNALRVLLSAFMRFLALHHHFEPVLLALPMRHSLVAFVVLSAIDNPKICKGRLVAGT
jgi:hypothetical protein